ncbi:MAG: alginate export family protein [Gammaproteobacteria bacterium]
MKSSSCLPAVRAESVFRPAPLALLTAPLALLAATLAPVAQAADAIGDAIAGGKAKLELRYRFENVEQEPLAREANASTLRVRLNYATGEWQSTTAFVEIDSLSDMGDGHYNSTRNGETTYPIVADPEGADINQAFLKYVGIGNTVITAGRQRINLDGQRFIGSVGWRQNEQTMDGVLVEFKGVDRLTATYAYIDDVHRVFGPENVPFPNTGANAANIGTFAGETHLLNLKYVLGEKLTVVAYDYLLDFDNANPALSTDTLGLRLTGKLPVASLKFGYTLDAAQQKEYRDNPGDFEAPYLLGEFTLGGGDKVKWEVLAGYELLGEDNGSAVSTPLATLHKFQGWADKFLATPAVGLKDSYLGGTVTIAGYGLTAAVHEYEGDDNGADYGDEVNVQLSKTFAKRYTLTAKYADYATGDVAAVTDSTKAWLMAEAKF